MKPVASISETMLLNDPWILAGQHQEETWGRASHSAGNFNGEQPDAIGVLSIEAPLLAPSQNLVKLLPD